MGKYLRCNRSKKAYSAHAVILHNTDVTSQGNFREKQSYQFVKTNTGSVGREEI